MKQQNAFPDGLLVVARRLADCACDAIATNSPPHSHAMACSGLQHFREPAANEADGFHVPGFVLKPGHSIITIDGPEAA